VGLVIDLVGHFGSRFSYATVSYQLMLGLRELFVLGSVTNLDADTVYDDVRSEAKSAGHAVIVVSDPQAHVVDPLFELYGETGVALFLSPNTTNLDQKRTEICGRAGRIYVPSRYCERTVQRALVHGHHVSADVVVMPLGVASAFLRSERRVERDWSLSNLSGLRMLHLSTDGYWPGRKGTDELLVAWKLWEKQVRSPVRGFSLTVHVTPSLADVVTRRIGDLALENVRVEVGPERGMQDYALRALFDAHDVLVQPSRCEGFGIMPLSALCFGLLVYTTADTGQAEYLFPEAEPRGETQGVTACSPWSNWVQIPTLAPAPLAGEFGEAPEIDPEQLGGVLVRDQVRPPQRRPDVHEWSWETRRRRWASSLAEWSMR